MFCTAVVGLCLCVTVHESLLVNIVFVSMFMNMYVIYYCYLGLCVQSVNQSVVKKNLYSASCIVLNGSA